MSRVHDTIRVLIFVNATLRPPLRQIDKRIFDNNLSGIVEFVDKLPTQSAQERDAFFRQPVPQQDDFADVGILPREPFTRYIVPEVLRIMRVRETGVRLALMQHFDGYVHEIPVTTLKTVVVPEVCSACSGLV
ncbi:unnamed protein product [Sphagnum balticum]